ncbi:MAG: GNAT family N-acetyltransferase [Kiloniellales bacterium]|nr:GNAT family N-acetyltransferase [Kiloniellales bacterium]
MSPSFPPIEIAWEACPRPAWERLLRRAGKSSLEQSWSYGEAVARYAGQSVARAVVSRGGRALALVQVFGRRLGPLGRLQRILRGPVWLDAGLDARTQGEVLRAIKGRFGLRRRAPLLWLPELPDAPASAALMRGLGSRRMVTGYSSLWLDLAQSETALRSGLHVKWRNALKAAERQRLKVEADHGGRRLDESLARYDRFRRGRRFAGPSGAFIAALAEAGRRGREVLHLGAEAGGELRAGIVLVRHGAAATYYAGWTSPEGRRDKAHNLLLWQGLLALKAGGTRWLDLGGVSPTAPGVARFKLGLGGELFTLTGTYL